MKLIEKKVKSENSHLPKRPIYLVGDSLGACLALAVAARNPHMDLALILANPGQILFFWSEKKESVFRSLLHYYIFIDNNLDIHHTYKKNTP